MRNQVRRDIETQFGRIVEDPRLYAVLLAAYENCGFEAVKCIDFRKVHVVSAPLRSRALPLRRHCVPGDTTVAHAAVHRLEMRCIIWLICSNLSSSRVITRSAVKIPPSTGM